jgi:hypothetical protein
VVQGVAGLSASALADGALGVDASSLARPELIGEVDGVVEQIQLLALS